MDMKIDITDIADWFLSKESMTNKKLQKLCYYTIAWGHALMNRSIATNAQFEAWVHGPVSPTLYRKYKEYGWNAVPKVRRIIKMPTDIEELLEAVCLTYGGKSGNELEALSHSEAPWKSARNGLDDDQPSHNKIDPITMKNFYNSIKSSEY